MVPRAIHDDMRRTQIGKDTMRMLFVMLLVLISAPAIGQEIEQPPFVTKGVRVIHDIPYNEQNKVIDSARIFEGCFCYPNDGTIEARDFFIAQITDYFEPLQVGWGRQKVSKPNWLFRATNASHIALL